MALAVPLSRFTSRVGGGSAFFVRRHDLARFMKTHKRLLYLKGTCKTLKSVMIVSVVVFIICVGILLAFSGDQLDCQSMTKLLVGIIAIGTGAFFTRRHFARELERLNRETLPEEVKDAVIKAKPSYLGFLAFGPLLLGIFLASHNSGTGYDTPFVVFFMVLPGFSG